MSTVDKHPPGTIGWFDLMTKDAEAARGFYGELFNWSFEVGGADTGGYTMAKLGGRHAAGIGTIPPGTPWPPAWTVYFISEDVDATAARITEHGGKLMFPPMDVTDAGRLLMAHDATGAVFGVWQPRNHHGAGVAEEPGAMAWCEVNTRDAAKARDFYAAVFDLAGKPLETPAMEYWTLHRDDKTVSGILQMDSHWPPEVPPHWMTYFQVASTDDACARVKKLGGKVCVPGFDSPYGRIAVLEDPQGALFSIMSPPPAKT